MTLDNLTPRAASERALHNAHMVQADFNLAPFTIAWEVTRACAYACVHCRADAMHKPDPNELNTEEAWRLIDSLAEFGSPILVFTGGDPMMRRDLYQLIAYATQKGLRLLAAVEPSLEKLQARMLDPLSAPERKEFLRMVGLILASHERGPRRPAPRKRGAD